MLNRITLNIGLLMITLYLCYQQRWQSGDIAWRMWLSSMFIGYIYIFAGTILKSRSVLANNVNDDIRNLPHASSLLLLFIFTMHFMLFHYGSSLFLGTFFPLESGAAIREANGGFATSFNFFQTTSMAFPRYNDFILIVLMLHAHDIIQTAKGKSPFTILTPYAAIAKNYSVLFALGVLIYILDTALVLYFVLIAYFFPYYEIFTLFFKKDEITK